MKKIVIKNYVDYGDMPEKKTLVIMGDEDMEVADSYHSMEDLYSHRMTLFIVLCKFFAALNHFGSFKDVWRSKVNGDGSVWEGWFILGINKEEGKQITYHIPIDRWDETNFAETLEKAPDWDGHTPNDVINRLKNL
jgi:hypothetical protein